MKRLCQFLYLSCLVCVLPCRAENNFFPNMSDIPLMDGLTVQSTEDVNFDTPVGQIINVDVYSKDVSSCRILRFYHDVLPQMGWSSIDNNKFVRDKDSLLINVINSQNPAVVRFEMTLNNPIE